VPIELDIKIKSKTKLVDKVISGKASTFILH